MLSECGVFCYDGAIAGIICQSNSYFSKMKFFLIIVEMLAPCSLTISWKLGSGKIPKIGILGLLLFWIGISTCLKLKFKNDGLWQAL